MRKSEIHLANETANVQKQSRYAKMKWKREYVAAYTLKNEQVILPSVMNKQLITQKT